MSAPKNTWATVADGTRYMRSVADARATDGSQPWDLEQWHCVLPTYNATPPACVPSNASRDYGYVEDGQQVVVFRRVVRRASSAA